MVLGPRGPPCMHRFILISAAGHPQAEATRSGEGKKDDPGVHRGEPNRKGSNKQIAAKLDCYNQPEATTIL